MRKKMSVRERKRTYPNDLGEALYSHLVGGGGGGFFSVFFLLFFLAKIRADPWGPALDTLLLCPVYSPIRELYLLRSISG